MPRIWAGFLNRSCWHLRTASVRISAAGPTAARRTQPRDRLSLKEAGGCPAGLRPANTQGKVGQAVGGTVAQSWQCPEPGSFCTAVRPQQGPSDMGDGLFAWFLPASRLPTLPPAPPSQFSCPFAFPLLPCGTNRILCPPSSPAVSLLSMPLILSSPNSEAPRCPLSTQCQLSLPGLGARCSLRRLA